MKLNHEQFLKHIKKHGITLARTTEEYNVCNVIIPKNTKLWFKTCGEHVSSYEDENKEFNYDFNYNQNYTWRDHYKGLFEIEETPEKPKFKEGDRVKWETDGYIGTIKCRCESFTDSWDLGDGEHTSCNENYLELVKKEEKKTEDPSKLIVHCPTQEYWDKVMKKAGYDLNRWDEHERNSAIEIKDNSYAGWSDMDFFKGDEYFKEYTFLTAQEYLGEEKEVREEDFCDWCPLEEENRGCKSALVNCEGSHCEEAEEAYNEEKEDEFAWQPLPVPVDYSSMPSLKKEKKETVAYMGFTAPQQLNKPNIIKKSMSNIVKFAKDLKLSKDDKELRKAGLKDSEGNNYTSEAREIVRDLEAVDLGFKSYDALEDKHKHNVSDRVGLSSLDYLRLFTKFEKELLETARKYNAEQKKS